MTMLVTLVQAKAHLRIEAAATAQDGDVSFKATHASDIVRNYVTHEGKDSWTDVTVPGSVQAAVLIVLSDLWEHRAGSDVDDVFLSAAAKSLLHRYRDPTLA